MHQGGREVRTMADADTSPGMMSSSTLPPQLSYEEAHQLASRLRKALKEHTKDRKWRFKTYQMCFKATHAIDYTKENETGGDEKVAVQQLNELIEYGFLCHVVDPLKTMRFPETRVLYFRIVDEIVDNHNPDTQLQLREGFSLINGKFGSSIRADGSANILALQIRLDGVNHVLQETVAELNSANGRLEMLHQEVLSLVSNQASMMGFIILLSLYIIIIAVVQFTDDRKWDSLSLVATSLLIIATTSHGMNLLTMWSDADKTAKRMLPPVDSIETETFATIDDVTDDILQPESRSFMMNGKRSTSIVSILSRSMSSFMKRAPMKKLSSGVPVYAREAYSLPTVDEWPHRPLFVCINTPACSKMEVPKYGLGACPIGAPFHFESDVFKGTCLIRLRGSHSDDPEGDEEYFFGRKRIFQSVIQGSFKEKVKVADVLTGHEFTRPLKNLPHPWVLKTATNFIGKVSPGAHIEAHTDQPFVEAILGGSSQIIRGDMPGQEPNITSRNLEEDCSVLGGVFANDDVTASKRKKLLSNSKTNQHYSFDTDTVYTFEFYQNLFDATTYSLDLGFVKIGCSHILNGQPIQWLGKLRDGRYLWNFQIWNEKLLKAASQAR